MNAPVAASAALAYERGNKAHQSGDLAGAEAGYREALAAMPGHADSLHLLGVLYAQRGRLGEAEAMLRRALAASPDNAAVHGNLANVLASGGRHADALVHFDRATVLAPIFADPFMNRARALRELGRVDEAIASAERATRLRPDFAEAHVMLAMTLAGAGRFEPALRAYERAIELRPGHGEAHLGRGLLLWSAGRMAESLVAFDRAIAADTGSAQAWVGRSGAMRGLGFAADALASAERALQIAPDLAAAHCSRGLALTDLRRHDEALASLERALELQPGHGEAENGRGVVLHERGQYAEALEAFRRAIAANPSLAHAHSNLGIVLGDLERDEEAEAAFAEALRLAPRAAGAWVGRAILRQNAGKLAAALEDFKQAQKVEPQHMEAKWNACILRLRMGDFERAWPVWDEVRWRMMPGITYVSRAEPEWDGRFVDGTLLAWAEQGIGDQILHLGLVPELARFARKVVVAVAPKLVSLAARSLPGIEVIPLDQSARHPCNVHVPLCSIGRRLRRRWADFPSTRRAFLRADPARVAAVREAARGGARFVCGLSWTSVSPKQGAHKSLALEDLRPVIALDGVRSLDLQYTDSSAERGAFAAATGLGVARAEGYDLFSDLEAAAALMEACDAVVTVSNTNAHLAGALGRPTLLLAQFSRASLWYWHDSREVSPWYPSLRILRQPVRGDWASAVARARDAVASMAAGT